MEARLPRAALLAACFLSLGASYRTENFIVTAPTTQLAQEVAESAENFRRDLAVEWLGRELPPWGDKCPITVHAGPHLGAGGVTQFMFQGGRPFGWSMSVQGSRQRILDSVLPHEVTHTIFATHFGRPLPRWADEGACTTVEHSSEKTKQQRLLIEFLTSERGIPFNHMFAMKEYPPDILPLYAQGFSLARFLIAQGGKRKFIDYIGDGMKARNWTHATRQHYGFENLSELQLTWLDWVRQGSRPQAAAALAQQPRAGQAATLIAASAGEPATTVAGGATADVAGPATATLAAHETATAAAGQVATATRGATASRDGWYARVRDEAIARRRDGGLPEPTDAGATPVKTAAATRPQPMGRAQQVILEWSRPPAAAAAGAAPATAAAPAAAPRSQLVAPEVLRGTLLR